MSTNKEIKTKSNSVKLYSILLKYKDSSGYVVLSNAILSKKMGCSKRTVQRALRELEDSMVVKIRVVEYSYRFISVM